MDADDTSSRVEYEIPFSYEPVIDAVEDEGIGLDEYDRLRDDLEAFFDGAAMEWLEAGFENTAEQYLPDQTDPSFEDWAYDHTEDRGGTLTVAVEDQLDTEDEQKLYRAVGYATDRLLHHADPLSGDRELTHDIDPADEDAELRFDLK